ncbi:Down syndrome cell adhesion molecule-like protein 1 homolog [Ixodes scapularis]|uniref:Down syndrome cell adhesion molecule-like protein 1 homolog n=1 Tax=Ixodes scapularis TaxID=6945 RepID=UPI001C3921EA|nr:Down syndrome cell adhesion molecule-like protein 1 homolog [Ixodes scapularis]
MWSVCRALRAGDVRDAGELAIFRASAAVQRRLLLMMMMMLMVTSDRARADGEPKVQPFHFPKTVLRGENVKVVCSAASGATPLNFQWLRDGQRLSSDGAQVSIKTFDDFSVLVVNNVGVAHNGNYTCSLKNHQGGDAFSSQLLVQASPQWESPPRDVSAALDGPASLDCLAVGYPTPTVRWAKEEPVSEDGETDLRPVSLVGARVSQLSNGTLFIREVRKEDAGNYHCTVSNGLGQDLHKLVTLSLHVPARFEQKFSVESVRRGDTAILRCEAVGDSPMGVTWHRNDDPLPLDSPRLQVFESVTDRGTASELHVQGAERSENGLFSCLAKNGFGSDRRSIKLVVLEVPASPLDVKVDQSWSRSANVRWNAPYSGNSPVSKYIVQYWKDHGAAHRLEEASVTAPQTSTLLRDLQPGTSYIVRALAENTVGRGSPSESQKFQTKEEEPGGVPTDVAAEPRGPSSLRIKWKPPPKEQWNGQLLGFYIGYRPKGSEDPYSYQSAPMTDQAEEEHLLAGLKRATEYAIVVKAFNAAGSGPGSQDIVARTADSEPPLPPRLWLESHERFSIVVHWQQPPGPPVTHYILSYREETGPWRELTVPQADNSKYSLTGLREATRYQIYLQAAGEGSTSAPSEIITVLTEGGALSDASMPAPQGSQSRELPVYFRLSVVAPAAASLTIVVLVIAGACLFVSHERRKYQNVAVPPLKPLKTGTCMSGPGSLGRPSGQRYVDVDQRFGPPQPRTPRHTDGVDRGGARPLLGPSSSSCLPQYPAPYATLPLRCPLERPSPSRLSRNAKGTSLSQDILDRDLPCQGNITEEAAEIHHYDIAA